MNEIPVRLSLVAQVKAILRRQIETGVWKEGLPSEVKLCGDLQISRVTLRAALAELVAEKVISSGRGQRRRILGRRKKERVARSKLIVLLTAMPMEEMPRFELYWVDDIRNHLTDAGFHLEVHKNSACFGANPGGSLEELAQRLNPSGWVLLKSTRAMQRWFSKQSLPTVIAGSRHEGVSLPFVDIDYRAVCRHAAGRFLGKGHRWLAFVGLNSGLAGDLESEEGFLEAVKKAGGDAKGLVVRHNQTPEDVCRRMDALLRRPERPTAFLVSKAFHALTVLSWLRSRGFRVPEDCSVISRDSESYLAHTVPVLTHYVANPEKLARRISRLLLEMISTGMVVDKECRIMPEFVAGGTLGELRTAPRG